MVSNYQRWNWNFEINFVRMIKSIFIWIKYSYFLPLFYMYILPKLILFEVRLRLLCESTAVILLIVIRLIIVLIDCYKELKNGLKELLLEIQIQMFLKVYIIYKLLEWIWNKLPKKVRKQIRRFFWVKMFFDFLWLLLKWLLKVFLAWLCHVSRAFCYFRLGSLWPFCCCGVASCPATPLSSSYAFTLTLGTLRWLRSSSLGRYAGLKSKGLGLNAWEKIKDFFRWLWLWLSNGNACLHNKNNDGNVMLIKVFVKVNVTFLLLLMVISVFFPLPFFGPTTLVPASLAGLVGSYGYASIGTLIFEKHIVLICGFLSISSFFDWIMIIVVVVISSIVLIYSIDYLDIIFSVATF